MKHRHHGFTLVEIMVGITIIGLLTSMAMPSIQKARQQSLASALAGSFRTYIQAFEIEAMEYGWPPDTTPGIIPIGMEQCLPGFDEPSPGGGIWDWEFQAVGVTAGVTLRETNADSATLERIDAILDDGNLLTGNFVENGNGVTFILEP
jgi:prepilin-type N-terminal cleavage/methylation domain-containing protein